MIEAVVRGELDEAQTLRLCRESPELVTLALLAAGKRIAELQGQSPDPQPSPATPSGMVPIYTKPNTTKRHKKPGAQKGHPGHRRQCPKRTNAYRQHRLKRCPCCGGPLQRCDRKRTRTIEDISEEVEPVVTEHTIRRASYFHH